MNIDGAIKELREDREHPTADFLPKLKAAEQLGIEALERKKEVMRAIAIGQSDESIQLLILKPLPSEEE